MDNGRRTSPRAPHDLAIAILEKKWSAQIVVLLRDGPRRFTELYHHIPYVSHKVLIEQLRVLERDHVLERRESAGGPRQVLYELTVAGKELLPIIDALGRWGRTHAETVIPLSDGSVSDMAKPRSGETQTLGLLPGNEPPGAELPGTYVRHDP